MRLSRAIPVLVAGAAAVWFLERRRGLIGEMRPALPRPEPEQPTAELPAVEPLDQAQPADVATLVDDLMTGPERREPTIVDAEVVEERHGPARPARPSDDQLAEAVRDALAEEAGVPPGAVSVEVSGGNVYLRGQIDRPRAITELERRAREVAGVRRVRSLLHLPGTPPPG